MCMPVFVWLANKYRSSVHFGVGMASGIKTIRVVVKTAPLTFKGVKGEGEVSLIEESPISVLAEKGSNGRHFKKRYHLKVEGFRVYPGDMPANDDAMYLYLMRDKLDIAQVNLGWAIQDGHLVSSSVAMRSMHDTTDSEIVLFDQGIGGSLKGGDIRSEDAFQQVMKSLSIHDLLAEADKLDLIHIGDSMVKKYAHIFAENNVKIASSLFVSASGGIGDEFLQNAPYSFKAKDLKKLHTAVHHLREKHCSGATTMEQNIVLVDVEEVKSVLVIQPPNLKPVKGSVSVAAYCNLKPCRRLEDVVKQQKEKDLQEMLLNGGKLAPTNSTVLVSSRSSTPDKSGGSLFGSLIPGSGKNPLDALDLSKEKRLRLELVERSKKVMHNQRQVRRRFHRARTPSPKSALRLPIIPSALIKSAIGGSHNTKKVPNVEIETLEEKKKKKKEKKAEKKEKKKLLKEEQANKEDAQEEKSIVIEEEDNQSTGSKKKKKKKKKDKQSKAHDISSSEGGGGEDVMSDNDDNGSKNSKKEKKKEKKKKKKDKEMTESSSPTSDEDDSKIMPPPPPPSLSSPHQKTSNALVVKSNTPPISPPGSSSGGRKKNKFASAFIFEEMFRNLQCIEDGRVLARKILKYHTDIERRIWRRVNKLPDLPQPLNKSQLKKHGPEPPKTKRLKWIGFDQMLAETCGFVALPPRVMRVHEAVSNYYSLGSKGIDSDAVSVALLLISRVPCMEGSPAFITPSDAFATFDTDRDGHLDQPEYDEAMRSLYGAHTSESSLAGTFVDHCDGSGKCSMSGFFEACAILSDTATELWKRKSLHYPPVGEEMVLDEHGLVARAEDGNFDAEAVKNHHHFKQKPSYLKSGKEVITKAASIVGGGLSYVVGMKSAMMTSLSDLYAREHHFIVSSIESSLKAVLDEEKERSNKAEAERWAAAEEASGAAVQIKKNAALASREEATKREKRAAEAAVIASKQSEMKAKVRAARRAREKLVAAVEIEQKRMERQRREELRADCGADVLELKGLGMHKLSEYLDPKGRNGMHGVDRPRLAISQLVEVDISDNKLFGALEDEYLFQMESVLRFEASHNRLSSAVGLQQLSSCRIMRLSHNLIGPSLPDAIGIGANALLKLESLSLDNNKLETLPSTFGGMKSLKRLFLFNNEITSLPDHGCLGPLTSLVELRLRHNKLKQLPVDLSGMVSLQVLDLAYNLLMELPQAMSGLSALRHLDLSYNRVSEVEEEGLVGLKSLQFLELHHNLLIGRAPRSFGDLPNLNTCDLSYNRIELLSGGDDAFECCTMLERLVLSHNLIAGLPAEVGKLTRLHTLECSCNQISTLPPELGALQALHVLVLKTNKLNLLPPEIACLSSLQSLDLSDNKILRLPPSFSTMVSLTNLDMSHNLIKSPVPSSLGLVPNLETLHLQGNQIFSLPETLGYLRCLKSLDVSNNLIVSLPDSVSLLRRLNVLDLRRNNLEALPIGLGTLRELRTVEVGQNPLTELPRSFVDPSSDEILKWVKTELVFYRVAVKEWEAHEKSYSNNIFGLEHFLEQVAKGLPLEFANAIAPKSKKRHDDVIKEEGDEEDDDLSSYAPGSSIPDSLHSLASSSLGSPTNASVNTGASGSLTDQNSKQTSSSSSSLTTVQTGVSEKRMAMIRLAQEQAAKKASAQLLSQVTSFFFKCRARGVPPIYASVSMNEDEERQEISTLTQARRSYRASLAKDEADERFEGAVDDEVRRYNVMYKSHEEISGMELVDPFL